MCQSKSFILNDTKTKKVSNWMIIGTYGIRYLKKREAATRPEEDEKPFGRCLHRKARPPLKSKSKNSSEQEMGAK